MHNKAIFVGLLTALLIGIAFEILLGNGVYAMGGGIIGIMFFILQLLD